jgi:oligopeptide transport system ATP-binding protein
MTTALNAFVEVADLKVDFVLRRSLIGRPTRTLRAVDGVSFAINQGETLGLVGESGCGKTTTGRATILLQTPTAGTVRIGDMELTALPLRAQRKARRNMQMVFQDPYSSLDPRMKVGAAIREPLEIHGILHGAEATDRVNELLEAVGLPRDSVNRLPHEFSGGQRQRVAVARALAVWPSFIVCDEPISSLDVSVQAQVLNLLDDLQQQLGLTYLFIAHDLAAVRHISQRIAVMYLGKVVETAGRDELSKEPLHPYTRSLLSAVPRPNPVTERIRRRVVLRGDVPSALHPPTGCRFHTRCPYARELCRQQEPPLELVPSRRQVACHFWREVAAGALPNDRIEPPRVRATNRQTRDRSG